MLLLALHYMYMYKLAKTTYARSSQQTFLKLSYTCRLFCAYLFIKAKTRLYDMVKPGEGGYNLHVTVLTHNTNRLTFLICNIGFLSALLCLLDIFTIAFWLQAFTCVIFLLVNTSRSMYYPNALISLYKLCITSEVMNICIYVLSTSHRSSMVRDFTVPV